MQIVQKFRATVHCEKQKTRPRGFKVSEFRSLKQQTMDLCLNVTEGPFHGSSD